MQRPLNNIQDKLNELEGKFVQAPGEKLVDKFANELRSIIDEETDEHVAT